MARWQMQHSRAEVKLTCVRSRITLVKGHHVIYTVSNRNTYHPNRFSRHIIITRILARIPFVGGVPVVVLFCSV